MYSTNVNKKMRNLARYVGAKFDGKVTAVAVYVHIYE